ncbi:DUF4998 domain-containing protein [Maribellus sediminis]|uniref:DUF4998 domain-containing protein n=1 Tax=Maribellus sediminis TaxID=2696285 RepID=UPI00143164B9|nr:DUF4998 domain-containing protein [Maribellus sediminis]
MKKITKILIAVVAILSISGCSQMDDNYVDYLNMEKVYAPKIGNLKAVVGLKTATLTWDNPEGDIAKKILIDYQDDSLKFESMVDTAVLENLEIKGYHVSVYTIDAFNNYSIPVSIQIFPNGEN